MSKKEKILKKMCPVFLKISRALKNGKMDNVLGLWVLDMVDGKLSKFSCEKKQRLVLKIRLNFW